MAVFEYKAMLNGLPRGGTVTADTPRQARDLLRDQGLLLLDIKATRASSSRPALRRRRGHQQQDLIVFLRELGTLLAVGTPLLAALETLSQQRGRRAKLMIEQLADGVSGGQSLADAMAAQPEWFDDIAVSLTRVGESTGQLEHALKNLAAFREKQSRLRNRLTTALLYPAIVFMIGTGIAMFLMTYVVPILLGTLTQSGKELPALTAGVKGVSDFLLGWWWTLLAGVAVLAAAGKAFAATPGGGRWLHRGVLGLPVVGDLVRKENTSRMAVVLASLLRSGVEFVEAVRITRRTLRNKIFQEALVAYEKAVIAGSDIAGPLRSSKVFRPMVVHMLAVGQQSGQLEEMLEQLAAIYDEEVATASQRLTTVLEPLFIVLVAIMVGTIALATILPILEASNVL